MTSLIPIRDENPYKRFPIVTVALIAANVFVFLSVGASAQVFYRYGAVPCDVVGHCPNLAPGVEAVLAERTPLSSIFTSMFIHADILHLGFNMLFLWVFGNNVEDRLGRIRFVLFYLVTGVAAAFTHIAFNAGSTLPTVGASGAISGVLGAYFVLWPNAIVVSILPLGFFFWPIRTPAWVTLGLWFGAQVLEGVVGRLEQASGVAFLAHVGGFVCGAILAVPLRLGSRQRSSSFDHGFG